MRPYVICHMCTSLDGKIIGHRWGKLPGYKHESQLFETTAASFGIGAWMVGTTTRTRQHVIQAALIRLQQLARVLAAIPIALANRLRA